MRSYYETDDNETTNEQKYIWAEITDQSNKLYANAQHKVHPDSIVISHKMQSASALEIEVQLPGIPDLGCSKDKHLNTIFVHSLNEDEVASLFREMKASIAEGKLTNEEEIWALKWDVEIITSTCVD